MARIARVRSQTVTGGMEVADSVSDVVPCVVEGRTYEVGKGKEVEFVEKIGYVHHGDLPHTILGDPVDGVCRSVPGSLAPDGDR